LTHLPVTLGADVACEHAKSQVTLVTTVSILHPIVFGCVKTRSLTLLAAQTANANANWQTMYV
jgi:hypothetical protein